MDFFAGCLRKVLIILSLFYPDELKAKRYYIRIKYSHKLSRVQAENTFPAHSLSRWMLGIQPVSPGMQVVKISHNGFSDVEGSMPSPLGTLFVSWKGRDEDLTLEITVPQGMEVLFDKTREGQNIRAVTINDRKPVMLQETEEYWIIQPGQYSIGIDE
ncbi:MAG: alpha-L-rhamnosidase C-terminal domain-containing protein [Balneolales bacterium]